MCKYHLEDGSYSKCKNKQTNKQTNKRNNQAAVYMINCEETNGRGKKGGGGGTIVLRACELQNYSTY